MSKLTTNTINLQSILETINNLPDEGNKLPTLTNPGTSDDLLLDKQLIDGNGNVIEGTIPTKTASDLSVNEATVTVPQGYYSTDVNKTVATTPQAIPTIVVERNGLITATAVQTAGYVSAGRETDTYQLTTQAATTITPTKSVQTAVATYSYTTGPVKVAAIPNEYITTSDATAEANEIMNGETAYVNGSKVTGTFTIDEELIMQDDLITQIQNAVDNLPEASGGSGEENIADVCNISITEYANKLVSISYVKCENGTCTQITVIPDTPNFTITNVLCYSIIHIQYVPSYPIGESTNLTLISTQNGHSFSELTASPNETATIAIQYYDF